MRKPAFEALRKRREAGMKEALSVRCERCGVRRGQQCVALGNGLYAVAGVTPTAPHWERVKAASAKKRTRDAADETEK